MINEKINEMMAPEGDDFFKKELGVSKEQLIKILKDVAPEEFV